ncbi:hypothetical protein [Psychrobacillus sp.]|uniref:hypothetical protein n=1 Tax=Psychrobacillus sp. TaxID=1871623 RepID=UPI0028BDFD5D|nr:hypothetical protein [Psychrobacillus sp.]
MNNFNNKVSKFFAGLIMLPLVFFLVYALTLLLAEKIMNKSGFEITTLNRLIFAVVLASGISLLLTYMAYFILIKIFKVNKEFFMRIYHYTHLVFFYISGLITVLITIEPILLVENLITSSFGENWKFGTVILFLIVSNYTIFNSLIINDDFSLFKRVKSDKNKTLT